MRRIALIAAVTSLAMVSLHVRVRAAASPQGVWIGHGHAIRTADLDLVQITTEYESEFWFVAANAGSGGTVVSGEATVSYNLSFSDEKLRTLIARNLAAGNMPLAQIAGLDAVLAAGLGALNPGLAARDLVGMRMEYREFAPVRRGRITGAIAGDRISLRWAEAPPPINYQTFIVRATSDRPSANGTQPAYPPWIGDATIAEPLPGHLVAASGPDASRYHKDAVTISSLWSASRQAP